MKRILFLLCCAASCMMGKAQNSAGARTGLFYADWRFIKDSIIKANSSEYDAPHRFITI